MPDGGLPPQSDTACRGGRPLYPLARSRAGAAYGIEGLFYLPMRLGDRLQPRVSAWNIDECIATQNVRIWTGPAAGAYCINKKSNDIIKKKMYKKEIEFSAVLMNDILQAIILLVSGFFSGLFLGMGSGTTGAIIITSLTVMLGYSNHQAIGTSLLIDCLIGLIAGLLYFRKHNANLRPTLAIGIFGALGSFLGSQFTSQTPELALIFLLSTLLILLGISFLSKGLHSNIEFVRTKMKVHTLKKYTLVFFIIFSIIAGFGSGFTGMGIGGILALVLLHRTHECDQEPKGRPDERALPVSNRA